EVSSPNDEGDLPSLESSQAIATSPPLLLRVLYFSEVLNE
ncbi:hypothetical protein A2U01_0118602, partial [Trifolium medium]|nr:hypothetical protein [Trifolium medium]